MHEVHGLTGLFVAMDCDNEFNIWLSQDNKSKETPEQLDFLEYLGLSTNYEDWLVKRSDTDLSSPENNNVMEQERSEVYPENVDMTEQSSKVTSGSLSNNVQAMEEITKRDLKSWLCDPEIHTKFNDALKLKRSGKKRKLDDEGDENM